MTQQTQHRTHDAAKRWGVFVTVAAALFALVWLAWSVLNRPSFLPGINPLQRNTTVTVGLRQAPASLDIRTQGGHAVEQALLGNVYETLVQRNQSNQLEPGLASQWKVSKDALSYTLTLRPNLRFSNGDRLDAADVVWSLQQAVKGHFVGSDALSGLKSVENQGSSTIVITLANPNPTLLRALSGRAGIVYDAQANVDYSRGAVGSGPFIISGYQPGQSITFKRNGTYSAQRAASSQVTLRYYPDDVSLLSALRNNDVNMAIPDNPNLDASATGDPSLKVVDGMSTSKVLLAFNNSANAIFSDQQVRQATRYLVDSAAIAHAQPDAAAALGGPISQLEPGYEDLTGLFPHDSAKASSMLSYFSASYLGTMTFLVPQRYQALGETITQQLQDSGYFHVQMQVVDDATLNDRMAKGDYTMALMTMDETGDASAFANANSVFHYENGDAQRQYADALRATNGDDYRKATQAFARTVSQDAASDWLYTRKDRIVAKAKLEGYPKNMVDQILPLQNLAMK
ncbi:MULTISPECIES: ABC transporter substrate-binding protein [Bifidobacterium]|jgi:ABC-type transport system substrate-binding protein|uniref:ABC transporter substrate-binding protein n=1 Tax=Bifidobacterium tibiigranuli TaxID=2172043 RepID=A0A5N6S3Y3_9BIFI|nr:ABC transporter substrate-binding protein [Bifidobacterium tibiigranuli]KAE8129190.1 ABC transporter substrate-binding protein [Bifidobacterium tibiigranuli]KAE8129428.1 ABC transporter substrate-binding protein [Bifidobacterium tibiigranuli]MCI1210393.1 ABC transporter substrate-binding protein [Bifidobacterium tibiigranuli]MCI1221200.1 ABC transporter substrate-binding protein [Bifidobacterium tibiigranuli]MCI1231799.1 ABC transporter substrate-binding protein [Bifidobacterium tibiigranul